MKCINCGAELTDEMFESEMCFDCGFPVSQSVESSKETVSEYTHKNDEISQNKEPQKVENVSTSSDKSDNTEADKNVKKTHTVRNFFLVALLLFIVYIVICIVKDGSDSSDVKNHLNSGDWEIVSSQEYVRDGKQCMGYRIYVSSSYGSTQVYRDIFSYVVSNDNYYLHTVWIYGTHKSANGSSSADYILEEKFSGDIPYPVK